MLQQENQTQSANFEWRMVKILIVPAPHARTSLQAQVHDKSGSVDPLLGPDSTHPYCRAFLAWRHGDSRYKPGGKVIGAVPVS
jgi:hypothetical protein